MRQGCYKLKQDNMNQKKISQEYEKAIQYIYELMKSGELTIGSRLPTERALAETLGIGRNSTREALSIMNGTYRTPSGFWQLYIRKCRAVHKADNINDDCIKNCY